MAGLVALNGRDDSGRNQNHLWSDGRGVRWRADETGRSAIFYGVTRGAVVASDTLEEVAKATGRWRIDLEAAADYLVDGTVVGYDESRSFVAGISRVPPGASLELGNGRSEIHSPRNGSRSHPLGSAPAGVRSAVATEVADAVRSHAVVGVPVSGGLDSSAIAALANERTTVRAYCLGAPFGSVEEGRLREAFTETIGVEVVPVDVDPVGDLFALWRTENQKSNWPRGGLFTSVFDQIARRALDDGATAILLGEGADEVFGRPRNLARRLVRKGRLATAYRAVAADASAAAGIGVRHRSQLLGPISEPIAVAQRRADAADALHRRFIVPSIEPLLPQMSIAVVSPFAEPAVVDVARAVDMREHVASVRLRDKLVLRRAFEEVLPLTVAWHRKVGCADQQIEQRLIAQRRTDVLGLLASSPMKALGIDIDGLADGAVPYPLARLLVLATWLDSWSARAAAAGVAL
jgi:asparagine synthetase B (glutamine-hydrolysing)